MTSVAVVGATGMVGRTMLKVLEQRGFPADNLILLASERSAGQSIEFRGRMYPVEVLGEDSFEERDGLCIALFSAGGEAGGRYAPIAAAAGWVVVDNSSFWRMGKNVPLVVPEVNPEAALKHEGIIANPNCSTIQAMVALKPLHDRYGIKRVVYSTYQAASGAGMGGLKDLDETLKGNEPKKFPYKIAGNCIPMVDTLTENGYTKEEMKMIQETRKILNAPNMQVTATTVRVPVYFGHSESINVELCSEFHLQELKELLSQSPGLVVQDDPAAGLYPMPIFAEGKDDVFVGRIRRDFTVEHGINLWVVADNLRKGAATNAVQIAELLISQNKK